jgi:hypothetical protein
VHSWGSRWLLTFVTGLTAGRLSTYYVQGTLCPVGNKTALDLALESSRHGSVISEIIFKYQAGVPMKDGIRCDKTL